VRNLLESNPHAAPFQLDPEHFDPGTPGTQNETPAQALLLQNRRASTLPNAKLAHVSVATDRHEREERRNVR
jgi:hypothetical protein